jgi:hypothetical protein
VRKGNPFIPSPWRWLVLLGLLGAAGCPPPAVEPTTGTVALDVVNNSSDEIAYLYASPQGSENWGADVLGTANSIPPGTSFTVRVPPGTYDLMVEGFQHQELGRSMGVQLLVDSQWVVLGE